MVVSGCGAVNGFECVAVNVLEAEECALGTDVIYSVLVLDVDDVELDDVVCFADPLELLVLVCELELCAVDVVVGLELDEVLGLEVVCVEVFVLLDPPIPKLVSHIISNFGFGSDL